MMAMTVNCCLISLHHDREISVMSSRVVSNQGFSIRLFTNKKGSMTHHDLFEFAVIRHVITK